MKYIILISGGLATLKTVFWPVVALFKSLGTVGPLAIGSMTGMATAISAVGTALAPVMPWILGLAAIAATGFTFASIFGGKDEAGAALAKDMKSLNKAATVRSTRILENMALASAGSAKDTLTGKLISAQTTNITTHAKLNMPEKAVFVIDNTTSFWATFDKRAAAIAAGKPTKTRGA